MGTREKLIERFKKLPKDFTFEEVIRLLSALGFEVDNKGKTSGSRIRFYNSADENFINIHKPHPKSIMKEATMKDLYNRLKDDNYIK